jgi:hypothetical protein
MIAARVVTAATASAASEYAELPADAVENDGADDAGDPADPEGPEGPKDIGVVAHEMLSTSRAITARARVGLVVTAGK